MGDETTRSNTAVKVAIIPVILGLGASIWLGVYIDSHYFRRELSQEERRNEAVGAKVLPKELIKIVPNHPADRCLNIESAVLDGRSLTVYFRNVCHVPAGDYNIKIGWKGLAPDGTVITQAEHLHGRKEPRSRAKNGVQDKRVERFRGRPKNRNAKCVDKAMTSPTSSRKRKAKFRVGQVVRVYGIPEINEANKFLGYRQIDSTHKNSGLHYYMLDGNSVRESRLRKLTVREHGK